MHLSRLQKFILLQGYYEGKKKLSRVRLENFYERQKKKLKKRAVVKSITKSLERLIEKEFLIGYGTRTPHKWYIKEIKLTPKGRKEARRHLGEQQKLPFK